MGKEIKVVLAGNPNCGKTSLFNEIVGSKQKVGNFSGVTVEKVEGTVDFGEYTISFIDLPGTYSLTAYSPEEIIARNYILEENPDVVVNVVDATSLERNLYLTTQLMELECNLLIALNIYDEVERQGISIDIKQLEKLLGTHIIKTSAKKKYGFESLLKHIVRVYEGNISIPKNKISYQESLEEKIDGLASIIQNNSNTLHHRPERWLAIKLFENDHIIYGQFRDMPIMVKLLKYMMEANDFLEKRLEADAETLITESRYSFIRGAVNETVRYKKPSRKNATEIIDKILINRITGLPIFIFVMWAMFQLIFKFGDIPVHWTENLFIWMGNVMRSHINDPTVKSILVDGILAGVGGVLVYLPLILILFLSLTFLDATGYMARAAFVIDKVMHIFGLHGKSAIPLLTGFGCSIPAFMSTRILKNKSDRITTLLIIPFISCSAKLPVYTLIIGAFFSPKMAGNIMLAIYLFGILLALVSAKIFKSTVFNRKSEPFVMELPPYRLPSLKSLWYQLWHRASIYLRKAATVILLASVLIWFGSNFPRNQKVENTFNIELKKAENKTYTNNSEKSNTINKIRNDEVQSRIKYSFIGKTGRLIEPVIKPLGFDWRLGISLISGIAAKEVIISTLATTYAITSGKTDEEKQSLRMMLRNDVNYDTRTGLSLIVFILLYIPCIPASIVFHREAGSWRWTGIYLSYTLLTAWILSFIVFQVSGLFL